MKKLVENKKPFLNIPPGKFIQEELESRGWRQEDLTDIIGMTPKSINLLVNTKQAITPETAVLLGRAFDQSPQYWMNLETNYRLRLQETGPRQEMAEIKGLVYKYMPVLEMIKKGWLCKKDNPDDFIKEITIFWNIQKLDFTFFEKTLMPQFRKSSAYQSFNNNYALSWYRMAQKCASLYSVPSYNKENLEVLSGQIPEFTIREDGISEFISSLNQCGVKFFVLSHLQKTYVDGASFIDNGNPVVVYTARYGRLDNFWFTMAHEVAHILNHIENLTDFYIDSLDQKSANKIENEADKIAASYIRAMKIKTIFRPRVGYITREMVLEAATRLHVHPGIIVGVLQYNEMLPYRNLNEYKEPVILKIPETCLADNRIKEIVACAS